MKSLLHVLGALALAGFGARANADTIAYWNFNAYDEASSGLSLVANGGDGTIDLSSWAGGLDNFAGTTTNAQNSDVAGASLSVTGGGVAAPFPGNGSALFIELDLSDYTDVSITFATRGTSTGFNSSTWSYSINGGSFVDIGVSTATRSTSFALATVDFSAFSDLDNEANVIFRYTLNGASSASGNNRIDNFLVSGTFAPLAAIPEPSTYAAILGAVALAGVATRRRRA